MPSSYAEWPQCPKYGRRPQDRARRRQPPCRPAGNAGDQCQSAPRYLRCRIAVIANQLLTQRLTGGHDVAGRAGVEPTGRHVIWNGCRNVPGAYQRRRTVHRATGNRRQPGIGGTVGIEDVDRPATSDAGPLRPSGACRLARPPTGTPRRGASSKIRDSGGQIRVTSCPRSHHAAGPLPEYEFPGRPSRRRLRYGRFSCCLRELQSIQLGIQVLKR